jgi:hypothetical protein
LCEDFASRVFQRSGNPLFVVSLPSQRTGNGWRPPSPSLANKVSGLNDYHVPA